MSASTVARFAVCGVPPLAAPAAALIVVLSVRPLVAALPGYVCSVVNSSDARNHEASQPHPRTGWCTCKPLCARLAHQPNQPTSCVDNQPTGVLRAGAPHHRVAEHLVHQTAYRTTTTHRGWSASLRRRQQRVRPPSAAAAPGAPASLLLWHCWCTRWQRRQGPVRQPAVAASGWCARQPAAYRAGQPGQGPETIPGYTGRICGGGGAYHVLTSQTS
jgi:hypothetical protein